jgi:hypothetical protein
MIGVNAAILTSTSKNSIANKTPAIGALNAIPAATPQPISSPVLVTQFVALRII